MTNQHRAIPEQLQVPKKWSANIMPVDMEDCVKELRSRIEALEATQQASPSAERMLALQDQIRDGALTLADAVKEIGSKTTIRPPAERYPGCLAKWPGCYEGGYDPNCCRFPKSCSCEVRQDAPANPLKSAVHADFAGPQKGCKESLAIPLPRQLVERVATAMQPDTFDWSAYEPEARAAILEVAAAAVQMHPDKNLTWERVALWFEQEANR